MNNPARSVHNCLVLHKRTQGKAAAAELSEPAADGPETSRFWSNVSGSHLVSVWAVAGLRNHSFTHHLWLKPFFFVFSEKIKVSVNDFIIKAAAVTLKVGGVHDHFLLSLLKYLNDICFFIGLNYVVLLCLCFLWTDLLHFYCRKCQK